MKKAAWYEFNAQNKLKLPYTSLPHEFTQGLQPMMGAFNYQSRFALPHDFSLALGRGSFSFNNDLN